MANSDLAKELLLRKKKKMAGRHKMPDGHMMSNEEMKKQMAKMKSKTAY